MSSNHRRSTLTLTLYLVGSSKILFNKKTEQSSWRIFIAYVYCSLYDISRKLSLAGVGVRVKQIGPIAAKVYSTGVYVDRTAVIGKVKAILSKSKTYKDVLHSKEFDEKLVESDADKTIVLRMTRDVAGSTMTNAISESVKPRMKGKDKDALKKFSDILKKGLKDGAKKNTQFRFENCGNQRLVVSIDGTKWGSVTSPTLCKAFTDVYLGHSGVSHTLKESVAKTFHSWK